MNKKTYVCELEVGVIVSDLEVATKKLAQTAKVNIYLSSGLSSHETSEKTE